MKRSINVYKLSFIIPLLILIVVLYSFRGTISLILAYGPHHLPTHTAQEGCSWEQKIFSQSGVKFFLQNCGTNPPWLYSENANNEIVRSTTIPNDTRRVFTMKSIVKNSSSTPMEIMNNLYSRLTSEEQSNCSIQNADQPLSHFPNGKLLMTEAPHPTPHKTRYEIAVKPEVIQKILKANDDSLPANTQYDYLCGKEDGSTFTTPNPYFEFDDRISDKYLMVGSLGNDESVLIDLDSIEY